MKWEAAVGDYVREVMRQRDAAIEECAERILLSGTNWGMRVWTWFEGDRAITHVEPTPEVRSIVFEDGPAPDDMPDWRPCLVCHGGWTQRTTDLGPDPRLCRSCDGKGWIDARSV